MYHTFQVPGPSGVSPRSEAGRGGRSGSIKRVAISNACVECRRRKIKCDGAKPCSHCVYYGESCAYSKPKPRVHLSNKVIESLQAERNRYHSLLSRLFDRQDLEKLLTLSRPELVEIVLRPVAASTPSPAAESDGQAHPEPASTSDSAESLDALDQPPNQISQHDEAARHRMRVDGIADDINGLSFSVDRQSSYVGVSSITAALKVIVKTAPITKELVSPDRDDETPNSAFPRDEPEPYSLPPHGHGQALVDSFFAHVHPFMPMIGEDEFQDAYRTSRRRDSAWLALLNMVFALGSLASAMRTNLDHITYYQRARKHLDLEAFGSGSIDVLRALGLMGGYYLHWLNRPNEANGIMGATLRMALALGLHREFAHANRSRAENERADGNDSGIPDDIRRRTWWSLFCLDSWASIPTGRPTLGRGGLGIMVESPKIPEHLNIDGSVNPQSLKLLPIVYNTALCRIATKVQDFLAVSPLIKFDVLLSLDAELEKWHADLPSILTYPGYVRGRSRSSSGSVGSRRSSSPSRDECPDVLRTPRAVMHWRYHDVRILLHRPFLLAAALRRTPFANLTPEEQISVAKCQEYAGKTLAHIESNLADDLMLGWNAVWLAYQAVMVPLVSLFSALATPVSGSTTATTSPDANENAPSRTGRDDDIAEWTQQIQTAIHIFERMELFSVTARKSKDMVQRLFDASQMIAQRHQLHQPNPHAGAPSSTHSYIDPGLQRHYQPQPPQQQQQQRRRQQPAQLPQTHSQPEHIPPQHPQLHHQQPHPSHHSPPPQHSRFDPAVPILAPHPAPLTDLHMYHPMAYDPAAWQAFQGPGDGTADSMEFALDALEWDDTVPPGDTNNFLDVFESNGAAAVHHHQQHQQHHHHHHQQSQHIGNEVHHQGNHGNGTLDWGNGVGWGGPGAYGQP